MKLKSTGCLAILSVAALQTFAAVIGTNVPAIPLTADRVAALPEWKAYVENSVRQRQADQDFLHAEMQAHGLTNGIEPPYSANPKGTPLDRPASWYGGAEAHRIADCVVSFQTPAGGWSKHTNYSKHVRAPGEMFASDNNSRFLITNDFDRPADVHWDYIGTFDNDATMTELRFLAKVISAGGPDTAPWRASFTRGIHYILTAQYPNGGWPQVWPLQGGYHDTITINDDAVLNLIKLLRDVAYGQQDFSFVPADLRAQADASWKHGLDCLLAAQIKVDGRRTVWCQQHDALTLQPASARNYEMPAATSSESGTIVLFLMELPDPDSNVVASVHAAAAWFKKTAIMDKAWRKIGKEGRKLVAAPGDDPIWARYYEIGTDRPVFGDRDLTIHDDVNELSLERRNGYGWFRDTGKRVLEHYKNWAKLHPAQT
jgi:PelA/Pel-15E family pectate lyase